jgi:hypothetical protein
MLLSLCSWLDFRAFEGVSGVRARRWGGGERSGRPGRSGRLSGQTAELRGRSIGGFREAVVLARPSAAVGALGEPAVLNAPTTP